MLDRHCREGLERVAPTDPDVDAYQLRCLRAELDHLTSPIRRGAATDSFIRRHALQFYWTVSRAIGLGHLHDGTRRPRQRRPMKITEDSLVTGATCSLEPSRPRILVDVSSTTFIEKATGIQVTVREFATACYALGIGHPIFICRDGLFSALAPPSAPPLRLRPGDQLFLLDASWTLVDEIVAAVRSVESVGGCASVCVYDLVPLLYPALAPPGVTAMYRRWFERILPLCATALCISRTVADELRTYLDAEARTTPQPAVAWFDLAVRTCVATETSGSERLRRICDPNRTFLSVGTLEPRKGFPVALDAFDALWTLGRELDYLIIGRPGWNMRFFEKRILSHPLYGKRLHWLADASDADVAYAYRHARALLAPSIAEGFGLPLIEAARAGLPLIVSDIAVYREVTGGGALFVPPCRPADWAAAIARFADGIERPAAPEPRNQGWAHSVEMVRDVIWSRRPSAQAAPAPALRIPAGSSG